MPLRALPQPTAPNKTSNQTLKGSLVSRPRLPAFANFRAQFERQLQQPEFHWGKQYPVELPSGIPAEFHWGSARRQEKQENASLNAGFAKYVAFHISQHRALCNHCRKAMATHLCNSERLHKNLEPSFWLLESNLTCKRARSGFGFGLAISTQRWRRKTAQKGNQNWVPGVWGYSYKHHLSHTDSVRLRLLLIVRRPGFVGCSVNQKLLPLLSFFFCLLLLFFFFLSPFLLLLLPKELFGECISPPEPV